MPAWQAFPLEFTIVNCLMMITKVFNESNLPLRLFDAAHEGKNLGKKLKALIETHGWVTKLGKRNRLHLTLLIQTEMD